MANTYEQSVGFKIYVAQRSVFKAFKTALDSYNITPGQFNLISHLDNADELSQKALAECTHKEQATITRYLDLLERKKLVVRKRYKNDRRAYMVTITDKAQELLRATDSVVADCANRLVDNIDGKDLDTFVKVLEQLKDNADRFSGKQKAARE